MVSLIKEFNLTNVARFITRVLSHNYLCVLQFTILSYKYLEMGKACKKLCPEFREGTTPSTCDTTFVIVCRRKQQTLIYIVQHVAGKYCLTWPEWNSSELEWSLRLFIAKCVNQVV